MSMLDLIDRSQATLVVFSPDAVRAGLLRPLEHWLRDRTGCAPVVRGWVQHHPVSVAQFYARSTDGIGPHWELVTRLFASGPSLATIWSGPDATRALLAAKGRSHPARSAPGTIRASFWCDNPVCNLIHTSDDAQEARRELAILESLGFDHGPSDSGPGWSATTGPPDPVHCGTLALARVVSSIISGRRSPIPPPVVPAVGEARATVATIEAWLRSVRADLPSGIDEAVGQFLAAAVTPDELIGALSAEVAISDWQDLVLRCAVAGRREWLGS